MKKIFALLSLIILFFSGCVALEPTTVTRHSSLEGYKYVYITPTSEKTSVSGAVVGGTYGVYGATESKSVNPSDIISGYFLKRGYIKIPEIKPEYIDQTIIVNYGETKSKYDGFYYYEGVIIQIISAKTNEIVCVGTAEDRGDKEAKALLKAIDNCMEEIFK